ncbi:MAG TPA: metal-dependent hydrolase [Polyangiaceae bacterium]|nr:metal-dependent hydrolase [Polyangiaceae bacterium]
MDNVTHTLAGLLLAEAALLLHTRGAPATSSGLRAAACTVSMAANNFPDLDFIYVPITGGKLGYLLHHRGHTHTLVAGLPCALLVLFGAWIFLRLTRRRFSSREWLLLVLLAALGQVCHLALDFSNNYGVHPFWPLYGGWYYGDAVFIIEPWFWVTTLPVLVYLARSRVAKGVLLLLLGVMLVLVWVVPFVPALSAALVSGAVAALFVVLRRRSPGVRVATSFASSLAVLLAFVVCSRVARASVERQTRVQYANAKLLDVIVSPVPATPACFNALVLSLEGEKYVIRSADISPLPAWIAAGYCAPAVRGQTARMTPIEGAEARPASRSVLWRAERSAAAEELVSLARSSCQAHALLRFARAPFWLEQPPRTIVGDVRYDRNEALDFAEIELDEAAECPRFVPPWLPPRGDIPGLGSLY